MACVEVMRTSATATTRMPVLEHCHPTFKGDGKCSIKIPESLNCRLVFCGVCDFLLVVSLVFFGVFFILK